MTTTAILFDVVILLILAGFALHGASRGLLLSLCGLVAVLVAFIGGNFLADLLAPKVADYLEPKFASAIESRLEEQMQAALPSSDGALPEASVDVPLADILDILKDMGLYQSAVDAIDKAVEQGMTDVAASTAAAVAASIAETVAYMIWTVFSHALDLVARLPGLHFLNKTGGALLGLVKGCAILFLCAWVIRYLGHIIPEETVEQTTLLKFFLTTNPVALILGARAA